METAKVSLEFLATSSPSAVKINGTLKEGGQVGGALIRMGNQLTGGIQIALDGLDTGIDLRTRHMKEKYLETAKYPLAELTLGSLPFPEGGDFRMDTIPFEGKLKLHGVEKNVKGRASIWREGTTLGFAPQFQISLKDFGIENPRFLGVTVSEQVEVKGSVTGPMEEMIL